MVRRKSKQNEVSIASLAEDGLNSILKYAKSDKSEDKLIGFNALLVFLIITLSIASYFTKEINDMFSVILYLVISGIFSAIISIGYVKLFDIMANAVSNDEFAIKASISILFFNLSITLIGYLFSIATLIKVGYGFLFVQAFAALILGFIKVPVKAKLQEKTDKKIDLWIVLDRISIIAGIINFIIWGISLVVKFLL